MMRAVVLEQNDVVIKCPQCGNNTEFKAHSGRVSEDCCEVWIVCKCGHDPTVDNTSQRFESVMGGTDKFNVQPATGCWNDSIRRKAE